MPNHQIKNQSLHLLIHNFVENVAVLSVLHKEFKIIKILFHSLTQSTKKQFKIKTMNLANGKIA